MRIVVVCNHPCKRTQWFMNTGKRMGSELVFMNYEELIEKLPDLHSTVIKLEPPVHKECRIEAYQILSRTYRDLLYELQQIPHASSVRFLNSPKSILCSMDKYQTKQELVGFPVTPLLGVGFRSLDELLVCMKERGKYSIFLKPRYGSGAGGVMAIRFNPRTGQWVAYTTLCVSGSSIYNTKKINRFSGYKEVMQLAETVMHMDAIAEEWIIKDQLAGENYDLRVVCQAGQVDSMVVRCSRGTITNLHLNNKARLPEEIGLSADLQEEINNLCVHATQTMKLMYAGIDILLTRGNRVPYLIEVNGQGDHIYQDMYGENHIYTNQIRWIQSLNR